jgi:hypothetical protein
VIEDALEMSERDDELWCLAELPRIQGELVNAESGSIAEHFFSKSLDVAKRQKVLSWELRTTISLARLWREEGRLPEARLLLESVRRRFSEGFESVDMNTAREIIDLSS